MDIEFRVKFIEEPEPSNLFISIGGFNLFNENEYVMP
jgi:hypothetical protein